MENKQLSMVYHSLVNFLFCLIIMGAKSIMLLWSEKIVFFVCASFGMLIAHHNFYGKVNATYIFICLI